MAEAVPGYSSLPTEDTFSDNQEPFDLESVHTKLQSYSDEISAHMPNIPELPLDPAEMYSICLRSKELLCKESSLLELDVHSEINTIVIGTLNGNLLCLVKILETFGYPPNHSYLFLGNIIGDDHCSLAVMTLILVLKLKYPKYVHILRGQNESGLLLKANLVFRKECSRKYNHSVSKAFRLVFHSLPYAAVISKKIFCVSGGLSPALTNLRQIGIIQRPIDCPSHGLRCDLLWSSHGSETAGWAEASKSLFPTCTVRTYTFGGEIVSRFLIQNNFDIMCGAAGYKEYVPGGFQFSAWKQRVTLLSSPVERVDITSNGAVLIVDEQLNCSFKVITAVDMELRDPQINAN